VRGGEAQHLPRQALSTSEGTAQVRVLPADPDPGGPAGAGTLLLGHGAGGQRDAADVLALTALTGQGWTVVLVDQPWRVAGRRIATPPPRLDRAWLDVVAALSGDLAGSAGPGRSPDGAVLPRPWVYGGRSAGARVAARTSVGPDGSPVPGVAAVLCLAFPLHPPGRPERSRAEELLRPVDADLPVLVVQGRRDPMGTPQEIRAAVGDRPLTLQAVDGTHSPGRDLGAVTGAAAAFLAGLARGAR
jgi:hypothetical protein